MSLTKEIFFADADVDEIPRQNLVLRDFSHVVLHINSAILKGLHPNIPVEIFGPTVKHCAKFVCTSDDRSKTLVTSCKRHFKVGSFSAVPTEGNALDFTKCLAEQRLSAEHFVKRDLLFPLERRAGLGDKHRTGHGYIQILLVTDFKIQLFQSSADFCNAKYILISFGGKTKHKVEFDTVISCLKGSAYVVNLFVSHVFVDDVA